MGQNKRYFIFGVIIVLLATLLGGYRLPFYVYQPGSADALNPVVQVVDSYPSEGDMHLVTVRGGQATPLQYALASIRPYHDIYPMDEIRPEGVSENEYFNAQLHMMETSQEAATVVAYKAADKEINIEYKGVYVMSVLDGMPASDVVKVGDHIIKVDDQKIENAEDLISYVKPKKAGEKVQITYIRDEEEEKAFVKLAPFPQKPEQIGIGITLVTDRSIDVTPPVKFTSGEIGGPSAGLMFSLEIYDQLTESDYTKGYEIAGTGEISYEGNVGRIGGIDKKVIAADKDNCDIFFAPNEGGRKDSNYEVAKQTAKDIGTEMKVIPVDTFQDALDYLEKVEPKK